MGGLEGKRILVIDDAPDLLHFVELILKREGAQVFTALNGHDGLDQLHSAQPDLILLDIMMPDLHGFETCSRIIETSKTPVIFLTALAQVNDIVNGLNLGAVDYITKPFTPKVLVARINAVMRLTEQPNPEHTIVIYEDNYLKIDPEQHRVTVLGVPIHLTPTEYKLLSYLLMHANQVMTFADILDYVWGPAYRSSTNYVHVYVSKLRKKIEQNPRQPRYLLSEPGIGYRFATAYSA